MNHLPISTAKRQLMADLFNSDFSVVGASPEEMQALATVKTMVGRLLAARSIVQTVAPVWGKSGNFTFSTTDNAFHTAAYTSMAGNTYFDRIRLSERLIIVSDIGIGYARRFLNGIRIYTTSAQPVLVAQRNYHCFFYDEGNVIREATEMLMESVAEQLKQEGEPVLAEDLRVFVKLRVQEVYESPQIPTLVQAAQKKLGG